MNAKRYQILLELTKIYTMYLDDNNNVVVIGATGPMSTRLNSTGVSQYTLVYKKHRRSYGAHEIKAFLLKQPVVDVCIPVKSRVIKETTCKICKLEYPKGEMRVDGSCYICHSLSKKG